jgi:hypothetical protein
MAEPSANSRAVLRNRRTYAHWFVQLKWRALDDGVWDLVNPDGPDAPTFHTSPPAAPPTVQQLMEQRDQLKASEHTKAVEDYERRPQESRGTRPAPTEPTTFDEVRQEHASKLQDYNVASNLHKERSSQYRSFSKWLPTSINLEI